MLTMRTPSLLRLAWLSGGSTFGCVFGGGLDSRLTRLDCCWGEYTFYFCCFKRKGPMRISGLDTWLFWALVSGFESGPVCEWAGGEWSLLLRPFLLRGLCPSVVTLLFAYSLIFYREFVFLTPRNLLAIIFLSLDISLKLLFDDIYIRFAPIIVLSLRWIKIFFFVKIGKLTPLKRRQSTSYNCSVFFLISSQSSTTSLDVAGTSWHDLLIYTDRIGSTCFCWVSRLRTNQHKKRKECIKFYLAM
jgi:hypothetical protein